MHDFVVDTDQRVAGEAIRERRGRPGAVSGEYGGRNRIKIRSAHASADVVFKCIQRLTRDATRKTHSVQIG